MRSNWGTLQAVADQREKVGDTYVEAVVTGPTGVRARVDFHVDSGAALSVLPDEVWRKLELKPKRAELFQLADGTVIERDISECHIRLPQGDAHTPVILGKPGDVALLGVITLEELGLVLDPFERKLRRRRHYLLHVAAAPSPASEGGADAART